MELQSTLIWTAVFCLLTSSLAAQQPEALLDFSSFAQPSEAQPLEASYGVIQEEPKAIEGATLQEKPSFDSPLNPKKVLTAFFPGLYSDNPSLTWWSCEGCEKIMLSYPWWEEGETQRFPFVEGTQTRLNSYYEWRDKALVVFSSKPGYSVGGDEIRLDGAALGLAFLEREGDSYKTKAFAPALAYVGAFQDFAPPRVFTVNDETTLVQAISSNGPEKEAKYEHWDFFMNVDGGWKNVLHLPHAARLDVPEDEAWYSLLEIVPSMPGEPYRDLRITLIGTWRTKKALVYGKDVLPEATHEYIDKEEDFIFRLTQYYVFDVEKQAYVLEREDNTIKVKEQN